MSLFGLLYTAFIGGALCVGSVREDARSIYLKNSAIEHGYNTYKDARGVERSVKTGNQVVAQFESNGDIKYVDKNTMEVMHVTPRRKTVYEINVEMAEKLTKKWRDRAISEGRPVYSYETYDKWGTHDGYRLVDGDKEVGVNRGMVFRKKYPWFFICLFNPKADMTSDYYKKLYNEGVDRNKKILSDEYTAKEHGYSLSAIKILATSENVPVEYIK